MKKEKLLKTVICLCLLYFIVTKAYARIPDNIIQQEKAVVTIYIDDKNGKQIATGRGFIIKPDGTIATTYKIISKWLGADNTILFRINNFTFFPVKNVIAFDEVYDIALLRIAGEELQTINLTSTYSPQVGDNIFIVSSPYESGSTVFYRKIISIDKKNDFLHITPPVSEKNSGSPAFNLEGKVLGITTTFIESGEKLSVVIPVKYVSEMLNGYHIEQKNRKFIHSSETKTPSIDPSRLHELAKARAYVKKNTDSAKAHMELGLKLFKLGFHEDSTDAFKQSIRLKPDYAKAHLGLGVSYGRLGLFRKAIKAFKQAIKIKPDYAEVYNNLGVAYGNLGMIEEAIEAYKQALKIKPDYAEAYNNLGFAYGILDMYKEEIDAYKKALTIKPDYAKAHYNLGISYGKSGIYKTAIESFKQAIRIKPDYIKALFNLGVSYGKSGRHKEEIDAYKKAILIKPDYAKAHYNLGIAYSVSNKRSSAFKEYKILRKLAPELADNLFDLIYR
jgi:tetratricopeptide (TPR) repeat protein